MKAFIHKGEIPFVRILIPLIIGIGLACNFTPTITVFFYIKFLLIVLLVALAFFLGLYKQMNLYRMKWLGGVLVFIIIFLSGYLLTVYKSQKLNAIHFSKTKQQFLVVTIHSEPKLSGNILRFEVQVSHRIWDVQSSLADGNLLIALKLNKNAPDQYHYGDLLLIPSYYTEIEPPYNPSEFDFRSYLANKTIYHQVFINEDQINVLKKNEGEGLTAYSIAIRKKLVGRFNRFIRDKDAAAVASTLILGYKADLSKEVLNAYSSTGTMHVLSVSGMHVGIVFLVIAFLLKSMDRSKWLRFIKAILLVGLIWAYAAITGFSAAVCRAALMLSFVIIGKAKNRSLNTYNLVAISAVLLLIYNPFFLADVGFQLSYVAILGLIYLYPKIYHAFYIKNYVADKLWDYAALSIAAQIATFPISLYYFHQFPLYFLISNLFIVLPVVFIMYTGLAFILLPFDKISTLLGWLLERSISFTDSTLSKIEHLPYSVLGGIWITHWQYVLIYVLIFCLLFFLIYKRKMFLTASLLLVFVLVLSDSLNKIHHQKENKIVFYSLRKNTAVGFFEGRKATLLTDLTDKDKSYQFSLKPSLEADLITDKFLYRPETAMFGRNIFSDGNFIQFCNWKMLIVDKKFKAFQSRQTIHLNAVLIRDNPYVHVVDLLKTLKFRLLLIDGTNKDYNIHKWQEEAKKLKVNCYVLKKNPAYVIKL